MHTSCSLIPEIAANIVILAACAHVLFAAERKRRPGGVTGPWCQLGAGQDGYHT